jgi:ureidoacrylate peracid hydrolase
MRLTTYLLFTVGLMVACNNHKTTLADATDIDTVKNNASKNHATLNMMAKPNPISMDAANTAVIVVDMQNEFGSKGGMFDRAGLDISGIQKAVSPIANVLTIARQKNITIVYLNTELDSISFPWVDTSKYQIGATILAPDGSKNRVLFANNWGTKVVPTLTPKKQDVIVYKTKFSGFYQTKLDSVLKSLDLQYLVFTGCTTSVCVESTIREAYFRDYYSILLSDCTAEPLSQKNYEASLILVENRFGWVSNSTEFIKAVDTKSVDEKTH